MGSEFQIIELLASNFSNLKNCKTLDEKCSLLLDVLRQSGWKKVSLSFLNSKYETVKTLYSGFSSEMIQLAEAQKLPATKRKELLSSTVERWRIPPFYYLPWRDEKARLILTGGIRSEIPIQVRKEWHPHDLLYAPIYVQARPVAVLTLDEPHDPSEPSKVNLRVPTIIHSFLVEIINRYYDEEFDRHYRQIQKAIIDMGTIGLIELDESNRILSVNLSAEQLFKKPKEKLLDLRFDKIPVENWNEQVVPPLQKAITTLEPQTAVVAYTPIAQTYQLKLHFLPIHRMYDYWGMIVTLSSLEKADIFNYYRSVVDNVTAINAALLGDPPQVQTLLVDLLCRRFSCSYPRLYLLNKDHTQLDCIYSYDPRLEDLSFFSHEFNRNSLAANAIIENRVVYTNIKESEIRDLRRIWNRLGTQAAVAIPINISDEVKAALVCDVDIEKFFLDDSTELLLSFIGNLIALTLKTALSPSS